MTDAAHEPGFVELFTPKLISVLRERYRLANLKADVLAGLTVAIVALPLSMAIAIASGVTPDRGLFTAIVGGFCVSALGGSRYQIGGPAGAFIVLVLATVERFGVDGLLLATLLSGLILLVIGFLRLGAFVKYIPYPVTIGFTAGIAVIIFASQIKELLGLRLTGNEPGALLAKIGALGAAWSTVSIAATTLAMITMGVILGIRHWRPTWPALLIAVGLASMAAWAFSLPVDTIGTRFGGIPHSLPPPHLPDLSWVRVREMLPAALSFALLGSIESLLSAVVADSMTGRRHRSNPELVAQGVANIASALFGGFCVTGTIARTATNVRAGAYSPISGILHAVFLLVFMLIAAPLASYIPLAALAAVLTIVAWNMAERHEFWTLIRASRGDAIVLLATFLLVVFRDLTEGILVGFGLGALLFLHRIAQSVTITRADPDWTGPDIAAYRISGAFFFGAAAKIAATLDRQDEGAKAYVLDFVGVPVLDSTAAATIGTFVRKARARGAAVYLTGVGPVIRQVLLAHGIKPPLIHFKLRIPDALKVIREDPGPAWTADDELRPASAAPPDNDRRGPHRADPPRS